MSRDTRRRLSPSNPRRQVARLAPARQHRETAVVSDQPQAPELPLRRPADPRIPDPDLERARRPAHQRHPAPAALRHMAQRLTEQTVVRADSGTARAARPSGAVPPHREPGAPPRHAAPTRPRSPPVSPCPPLCHSDFRIASPPHGLTPGRSPTHPSDATFEQPWLRPGSAARSRDRRVMWSSTLLD